MESETDKTKQNKTKYIHIQSQSRVEDFKMNTFANSPAGRWMGIKKGTGAQPGNALKQKELKQLLAQKKQQLPCPLFLWRRSDVEHRLDFISFCESFGYMIYDALKTSEDYHVMGYLAQPSKDIEYALYSDINTNNFGQLSVFGQSPFGEYRSLPQLWVQCFNKSLIAEEKECVRSVFAEHMYSVDDYVKDNRNWQELTLDGDIQVTEGSSIEIIDDDSDEESDDEESDEVTGKIAWDNDGSEVIDVYLDKENARFIVGNVVRIGKKTYNIESIQELPVKQKNIAKHATTKKKYREFLADNKNGVDMKWLKSVQEFNDSNTNDNMLDKGRLFVGFDGTNLADFVQRFLAVMVLESKHVVSFKKLMKRICDNATLSEKKTTLERQIESLGAKANRLRNKFKGTTGPWVPLEKRKKELEEELDQFKDIPPIDFANEKKWMASLATEAVPYLIDYLFTFGPQRTVKTYQQLLFEQDMSLNGGKGGYLPQVEIMTSVVKALEITDDTTDIELVINKHHFYNFMQNVHFSPQNHGLHTVHGLFDDVTRFVSSMPFKEWKNLVGNDADGVAMAKNLHEFMRYEISGTGNEKKPIGGRKRGCEIMQQLLFHVEDAYKKYKEGDYPIFTLEFDEKKGSVILSLIGKDDDVELMEIDDVIPGDTNGAYTNGAKKSDGLKKSKKKVDTTPKKCSDTTLKKYSDGAKKKIDTADLDGFKKNKEVGVYLEVALSKIKERMVSNNQMFVELYDYLYLIVRSKISNQQQYHDHWHQGNENLNSTGYKTLMQRFESHELVQVTNDNVIVVEFANNKSKKLFTNAFVVADTASSSSTIPHPTFDWNIRWENMAQWNKENEKIAYDQLFEPFESFTIEKWFHGESKSWMDMTDTNFPLGIPIVLQLKQKTGLKRKFEEENLGIPKKKKPKTTSNESSNESFDTSDVVLRKMSKDLQVQTDGVVVCFFGNVQEGKETSNQQVFVNLKNIDYFSKNVATLKAKYKELFNKNIGNKYSKNKDWIMQKINKEDPEYSCPFRTDADADKKALIGNHNSAVNGIQLTFNVGEKINNDNVKVVGNIYNIIHQNTSFGTVDVKKSLVFHSSTEKNIADDDYNACILVPYGKTTIQQ